MTYDTTYKRFSPRLKAIVEELQTLLGGVGEVWENECCGYDAGFSLTFGEGEGMIDVKASLEDATLFDGCDPNLRGNVELVATGDGGLLIGQVAPYNYTPSVWVPLAPRGWPELEERLDIIREALPAIAERVRQEQSK